MCERVCEAIATKPKQYYQGAWFSLPIVCDEEEEKDVNICETSYCRAGWMVAIASQTPITIKNVRTRDYFVEALDLLGSKRPVSTIDDDWTTDGPLDEWEEASTPTFLDDEDQNFYEDIQHLFGAYAINFNVDPGTEEYAQSGIQGMRRFMEKWEVRLKAQKLQGGN
jgi:hypothetical protein